MKSATVRDLRIESDRISKGPPSGKAVQFHGRGWPFAEPVTQTPCEPNP